MHIKLRPGDQEIMLFRLQTAADFDERGEANEEFETVLAPTRR